MEKDPCNLTPEELNISHEILTHLNGDTADRDTIDLFIQECFETLQNSGETSKVVRADIKSKLGILSLYSTVTNGGFHRVETSNVEVASLSKEYGYPLIDVKLTIQRGEVTKSEEKDLLKALDMLKVMSEHASEPLLGSFAKALTSVLSINEENPRVYDPETDYEYSFGEAINEIIDTYRTKELVIQTIETIQDRKTLFLQKIEVEYTSEENDSNDEILLSLFIEDYKEGIEQGFTVWQDYSENYQEFLICDTDDQQYDEEDGDTHPEQTSYLTQLLNTNHIQIGALRALQRGMHSILTDKK